MQLQDLPEVDPAADEIAHDRVLVADHRGRGHRHRPAEAHDRVGAAAHQHPHAGRVGLVVTDEVHHQVRPAAAGEVAEALHDLGAVEHRVGAEPSRQRAALGVGIDRHDRASRAELPQQLEADVPHAADPERDDRGPRHHEVRKTLDRVVGRDPGVGVRRHVHGVQPVGQLHDRALGDDEVLGEATVHRQPGELVLLAHHVPAAPACHAQPAGVGRADEHGVAHGDGGHEVAHRGDASGVLVTEHDRQRQPGRLHLALDRVQVGRADSRPLDLDQHLVRARELRRLPLDQLERAVVLP